MLVPESVPASGTPPSVPPMPQPGGMGGHSQTNELLQKQRPLVPHGLPEVLHSLRQTLIASLLTQ